MSRFIKSTRELKFLNGRYDSKKAEMIVLYGRRRKLMLWGF
jgi:AAA+ ATPase superfamily predicted ATPase